MDAAPSAKKSTVKTRSAAFVARYLKTSRQTIEVLIAEGKIKAYKKTEGGHWRVDMGSVSRYARKVKKKYGIK